jgi:hypothetical protein
MKLARIFLSLAFLVSMVVPALAQKEDWLPITQQDLEIKQVPGSPGADAIQLYYADYINDETQTEFVYFRIKVLNEKGNSRADVEIVVPPGSSILGLKARTVHPDGKITEFTGRPFQKVLIKGRGLKLLAKTFTMPDVTVGSIIEYKYTVDSGEIRDSYWTIQHDLYTVKESFHMQPYSGLLIGYESGYQIAAIYSHMPGNIKPQQKRGGYELEVQGMPAFEAEGFMPPEDDFKPQIRFFYVGKKVATPDTFWQDAGRKWNDDAEHFIGNHKEISQAAIDAIGNETDPEPKLRLLYARAQKIRNLSYERERSDQEQRKENLKANQSVSDVLMRGAGYRDDITRLFVALVRAVGLNASIIRAGNRNERFFDKGLLSDRQLDSEIAVVNTGTRDIYLDPGTMFCPYGYIRWIRSSSLGLKLDKKGGAFVTVPGASYDKAVTTRVADMALDEAGTLKGTVTVKFEGGEALEHRLAGLDTDEAGKKKSLEDELEGNLPVGVNIKLVKSDGWETSDGPLTASFALEMPGYSSATGKRLLLPAYLFQSREMDAFKHADRKFPVYFPYAFGEVDSVSIKIPDGYTLESVLQEQSAHLDSATYQNQVQFEGRQIVTKRILQMNGIFFRLDLYPQIKDFFGKVQAGDEQQAVLKGGSTNAQKGN